MTLAHKSLPDLVPGAGLEPARACAQRILRPRSLPRASRSTACHHRISIDCGRGGARCSQCPATLPARVPHTGSPGPLPNRDCHLARAPRADFTWPSRERREHHRDERSVSACARSAEPGPAWATPPGGTPRASSWGPTSHHPACALVSVVREARLRSDRPARANERSPLARTPVARPGGAG